MDVQLAEFISKIKSRTNADRFGIHTASAYLKSLEDCLATGTCPAGLLQVSPGDWQKALSGAESRLTFCDPAMEIKGYREGGAVAGSILEFDHVITTMRKDRDGDIVEPAGMTLDPKAPLLWQHVAFQPIGVLAEKTRHDAEMMTGKSVILDTALGRDAAVLVKGGALRISHGFTPTEAEPLVRKDVSDTSPHGWRIKRGEIMEISLVSVPANSDAVIYAYSEKALHHPLVKIWAQKQYDTRPTIVRGATFQKSADGHACTCGAHGQPADSASKTAAAAGGSKDLNMGVGGGAAVTAPIGQDVVLNTVRIISQGSNPNTATGRSDVTCPNCGAKFDLTGVPDGMDLARPSCWFCGQPLDITGDRAPQNNSGTGDPAGANRGPDSLGPDTVVGQISMPGKSTAAKQSPSVRILGVKSSMHDMHRMTKAHECCKAAHAHLGAMLDEASGKSTGDLSLKEGRTLSAVNQHRAATAHGHTKDAIGHLSELIQSHLPGPPADNKTLGDDVVAGRNLDVAQDTDMANPSKLAKLLINKSLDMESEAAIALLRQVHEAVGTALEMRTGEQDLALLAEYVN